MRKAAVVFLPLLILGVAPFVYEVADPGAGPAAEEVGQPDRLSVSFEAGGFELMPRSSAALDSASAVIARNKRKIYEVHGYTCPDVGKKGASRRRVVQQVELIVERLISIGVPEANIIAVVNAPTASRAAGCADDNRVDIVVSTTARWRAAETAGKQPETAETPDTAKKEAEPKANAAKQTEAEPKADTVKQAESKTASARKQPGDASADGKGLSLTIYVPRAAGLEKEQGYIPTLVQGEFVSNFVNHSAISVLDWERLDDIYVKLTDEVWDDNAAAKQDVILGRLAPTSHFLTGNITRTATGYNVKVDITSTADKMTAAAYSGTFSFADLDNLTGVRRVSLELLQKMGVALSEKARRELTEAADINRIFAQTALAKGITAQRAGTEVAALSYYCQAAGYDPGLEEATGRSSAISAGIKGGNAGADLRNDIVARKKWLARLKETEESYYEMINAAAPPYTLYYSADIDAGNISRQKETVNISSAIYLSPNGMWFRTMKQSLQAARTVLDGLNATNRKNDWGLDKWPNIGVSETNPFAAPKKYDWTVAFELVDHQGRVIGNQSVKLTAAFGISANNVAYSGVIGQVKFDKVKVDSIGNKLTVRVASVNGASPRDARFTITAMSTSSEKAPPLVDNRDGKAYRTVKIGALTWMAENLNYQPQDGNSWCYGGNTSNCDKYGRLYDWAAATDVCPSGWYLPAGREWNHLANITGVGSAGKKLKSASGWRMNGNGTDAYGFSALPGGQRNYDGGFYNIGKFGHWWAATEDGNGYAYRIYYDDDGVYGDNKYYNGLGFSVRCVMDNAAPITAKKYAVTVTGGTGGGEYAAGTTVKINAGAAQPGYMFKNWAVTSGSASLNNANSAEAAFTMPTSAVTVTAEFDAATFADSRDNKTYRKINIGTQTWMMENLNYKPQDGNSWCYGNNASNCDKYGRLYDWSTAMNVCPSGWHLPTSGEWNLLVNKTGVKNAGNNLKSTRGWRTNGNGTDAYGFSALPGGYRNYYDGSYNHALKTGKWWGASDKGADHAYGLRIDGSYDNTSEYYNNKGYGYSVRCVRDD